MYPVLEKLYHGEISPQQCCNENKQQYSGQHENFVKELQQFDSSLPERFIQLMDEQLESIPHEVSQMFIYGFRLGAQIMIEVLIDPNEHK